VNEAKYDWVAMLSDDDLWGRYHLEESERLLRKHCGAIAVCSQTVTVRNACCQVLNGYAQLTHTFKKENHLEYDDCYVFKPGEILIDSLIRTPLNFWSLVARKSSVSKHIQVMSEDNPGIDSDRFFFWRLNSEGSIIAAREVGHFMRCHESMGGDLMSRQNEMKYDEKTKAYSYLIVKEAEAMGISVKENWRLFWESLNANDEEAILRNSYNDCVLIACRILNSGPFGKFRYLSVRALIIRTLKAWLPPILTNALIKLRNRVR
jgi:hypothetical protein